MYTERLREIYGKAIREVYGRYTGRLREIDETAIRTVREVYGRYTGGIRGGIRGRYGK